MEMKRQGGTIAFQRAQETCNGSKPGGDDKAGEDNENERG